MRDTARPSLTRWLRDSRAMSLHRSNDACSFIDISRPTVFRASSRIRLWLAVLATHCDQAQAASFITQRSRNCRSRTCILCA